MLTTTLPDALDFCRTCEEIAEFIASLKATYLVDAPRRIERRKANRLAINMPVEIRRLSSGLSKEKPMRAISKNISATGLGLILTRSIPDELVLVTLCASGHPPFEVVARVIHNNKIGAFFRVGLEFVISPSS